MFKNFSSNLTVTLIYILLGVLLGIFLIFVINKIFYKNKYAVFFLEDGSVYFGEVSFLNKYNLKNPVFLNRTQDGNLNVVYYSDLFYLPQNVLHLNPQKVIAWSYLRENSPLIDYIKRKPPIIPGQPPQPQQPQQQPEVPQNQSQQKSQ